MSTSGSNNNNVTSKEWGRRFRKALSVPFLLSRVCGPNVQEFVSSYSTSLGCSEKCFFFPLLSCAASCMGTDCGLQLTAHWSEPPILWTMVITPRSLQRMDVVEHLKQQLLQAQNEAWVLGRDEDSKEHLKKFLFDLFTLAQLQDMLRLSNGHGLVLYNSARALHRNLVQPEDVDILLRLHSGLAWFSDSRVTRGTLSKTRVNFAVVSTPAAVHQTLTSTPHFQELFHQCFLTTCAEENHVKFGQISDVSEADKLREIFVSLLKLHCTGGPIVYRLSAEARDKFSQIHDELTDKAKQMARKSAHKVFQPALAYLARLSCVLHVLDAVLDALNYKIPVSRLTWSTEIGATTVWQARELLGHIVEQRHALMEQTTIEPPQQKSPFIRIDDRPFTPPRYLNGACRNLTGGQQPVIASVSSAGLPVAQEAASLPQPVLLSRAPFTSVLDMSEEEFMSSHRGSVRKLLRHGVAEITPSRCVQLKLTPDPTASDESHRFTQAFARTFLKRLEGLGFGVCDGGSKSGGHLRHFVFKKKKFSALGDEQKQILGELNVSEADYSKGFALGLVTLE